MMKENNSDGGKNAMNDVLKRIEQYKVVPVVVLENTDHAAPLAKALRRGNLPDSGGRGFHPSDEADLPGDAGGRGNRHQHGTGGAGAPRGSGIYREPGV